MGYGDSAVTPRYVLTEISASYLEVWRRDPLISQFVQMGYMDYGVFNPETDRDITLSNMQVTISPRSLHIPPFVLCSSVLSAMPQDIVIYEGDAIKPALLTLLRPSAASPDLDAYKWGFPSRFTVDSRGVTRSAGT